MKHEYEEFLEGLKNSGMIMSYRINTETNDVYITPNKPVEYVEIKIQLTEPKYRKIPNYGDIFHISEVEEFYDMWDCGNGNWCNPKLNEMYGSIDNERPHNATHFIWFNK